MKIQFLGITVMCLFLGACAHGPSEDGNQPMEMTTTDEVDQDLESQLDKPASATQVEQPVVPTQVQEPIDTSALTQADTTSEPDAAPIPEEKEPPVPATKPPKQRSTKADLKYKLAKGSGKVTLSESKNTTKVAFSGSNLKKGLYTLMVEESCKKTKNKKTKPKKLAQFTVKKAGAFSNSLVSKTMSLKKLKGKAVVIYHGPKANTRMDCSTVKF